MSLKPDEIQEDCAKGGEEIPKYQSSLHISLGFNISISVNHPVGMSILWKMINPNLEPLCHPEGDWNYKVTSLYSGMYCGLL